MEVPMERQHAIWKEIIADAQHEVEEAQRPDEMTVQEFVAQTKMSVNWGRRYLDRLALAGKLNKRLVKIRGRDTALYSPVTDQI